jgi:fimbrial chaperone protein
LKKKFLNVALIAAFAAANPAWAGQFSVTPVRLFFAPKDRAIAVTITNDSDEALVMQADVYVWKQKKDGEDELTPSEDLFLSPPIIKLAPRARQVVRLAMLHPAKGDRQITYRMIVREIPEARAPKKTVELQIALAFSLPVFVTPPGAKAELDCSMERGAPNLVRAVCGNVGTAYAQPRDFSLVGADGTRIAGRDSGGYILPDSVKRFDMKRAEGPIQSGKARLDVTLDDGTKRTYDVSVPE